VTGAGLLKQAELVVAQGQEPSQFEGERSAAPSMVGVMTVVHPRRVVEHGEQEHDLTVGAVGFGGEVDPVPADPPPSCESPGRREPCEVESASTASSTSWTGANVTLSAATLTAERPGSEASSSVSFIRTTTRRSSS
jgi:hypothetical protein